MAIEFACDQCGKHFRVPEAQGGKRGRCKHCGHIMRIPVVGTAMPRPPPTPLPHLPPPPPPPPIDTPMQIVRAPAAKPSQTPPRPALVPPAAPSPAPLPPAPLPPEPPSPEPPSAVSPPSRRARVLTLAIGVPLIAAVVVAGLMPGLRWGRHSPLISLSAVAAIAPPSMPERGSGIALAGGIRFYPVYFDGSPAIPGQTMALWIYLPPGEHARHSLGCVLIAPGGTNGLTGKDLGPADRAELLPYVRAGFAVVGYSLDGPLRTPWGTLPEAERMAIMQAFMDAGGGLVNARNALYYVLAKLPEADPKRIFAAGRGSAGTLALLFASQESRLSGCAAFAPVTDVERSYSDTEWQAFDRLASGARQFAREESPIHLAGKINCPVYLFHAEDDSAVPTDDNAEFARAMREAGKRVEFVRTPNAGHDEPPLQAGVPGAIQWMAERMGLASGAPVEAPPATTAPVASTWPAGPVRNWEPDESLLSSLGPEMRVGAYGVRAPIGFRQMTDLKGPVIVRRVWARKSGTGEAPLLSVAIEQLPGEKPRFPVVTTQSEQPQAPGPDSRHLILNIGAKLDFGTIAGWPFTRAMNDPPSSDYPRRVTYYAYDGDKYIIIQLTTAADDVPTMDLMQTAARTFHKVGG